MSIWSSSCGKKKKQDANYGCLWKKIKRLFLNIKNRFFRSKPDIPSDCKDESCLCKKKKL